MKLKVLLTCAAVAAAMCAAQAKAGTVVIGAPGDPGNGNCFPFGCASGTNYQQVYAASDFSGPITITGLTFYNDQLPGGSNNTGNYQISLSTTSAAVNGLSATFSANIGADNTQIFNGSLPSLVDGIGFTIPFSQSFNYNPADGNLLLNVVYGGGSPGASYLDALNGDANGLFSRMQDFGAGNSDYGLVTGFQIGGVPEPATWTMLILGVAMIGFAVRRRREGMAVPA